MFTTLDSYGEPQGAFLMEAETPAPTDSSYKRHIGGNENGKENTEQDADDIFSISQD